MKFLAPLLLASRILLAQSESAAMQVTATPSSTAISSTITIQGTAPVDAAGAGKIVVTPPSAPPIPVTGKWDAQGNYFAEFNATKTEGQYKVVVTSAGGHASGNTTFNVRSAGNMSADLQAEEDQLVSAARDAFQLAADAVKAIPPSPATQDAQEKLKSLKQKLDEMPAQTAKLKQALEPIQKFSAKYPDEAHRFNPIWKDLSAWKARSAARREQINRQLSSSRQKGFKCEKLDQASEALNFFSVLLTLAGDPFKSLTEKL